jgi:hypothetical protein
MERQLLFVMLGIATGFLSGLTGIGGGVVLVPALVYAFGFSQQQAQGTSLAMFVVPVGLIGAFVYHKRGFVDLWAAALICTGFLLGSFGGSRLATDLPAIWLKRLFGSLLMILAVMMLTEK